MNAQFSPSLMCMDLTRFREQIEAMNSTAAFYHVDIMDGSYVKTLRYHRSLLRTYVKSPMCQLMCI